MSDLSAFPVTRKWPPQDPTRIQLYSLPTPNGVKASAMLEESGLAYEAHKVDFGSNDQTSPEFLALNPNNKIPAIIDPNGPEGAPFALWESGAILVYLAEKSGRLLPSAPGARYETLQWLMFQMGGVGPMFGQFGYFHRWAGSEIEDKRPHARYRDESRRLLKVLDGRLTERAFVMGADYTIADVALWPWARALGTTYDGAEALGLDAFEAVGAWLERCLARPASQAALTIPS